MSALRFMAHDYTGLSALFKPRADLCAWYPVIPCGMVGIITRMRILVCGNGWLGNILKDFLAADMSSLRLKDMGSTIVAQYEVIINCAGKTNIDWCEKNKSEALAVNAIGAGNLARVCEALGKKFVHLSSACIFESADEHDWKNEYSTPNP